MRHMGKQKGKLEVSITLTLFPPDENGKGASKILKANN